MDDFLQEIDEDVEGMQSTILFLQQELKAVRADNDRLKLTYEPEHAPESDTNSTTTPLNGNSATTTTTSPSTNNDNELTKPGSEQIVTKINLSRTQNGNISVNNGSVVENSSLTTQDEDDVSNSAENAKTNGDSNESNETAAVAAAPESLKRGYDKSENEVVNPKRTRRTAAIESSKKLCSIDTNSTGEKKVNGIVNVSS